MRGLGCARCAGWGVWMLAAAALAVLAGCGTADEDLGWQGRYRVAPVEVGPIRDVVPAMGEVRIEGLVEVGAEISGRIAAVHVARNARVEQGDRLLTIERRPFEAAHTLASARLAAAAARVRAQRAGLAGARARLARITPLARSGTAPAASRDDLVHEIAGLEAGLETALAEQRIAAAQLDEAAHALSRTEIRAPISGLVLDRRVQAGQVINSAQSAPVLFVLAPESEEILVEALVSEQDIHRVRLGMGVDAYPPYSSIPMSGEVLDIGQYPERKGRFVSYPVTVVIDDLSQRLGLGMSINLEFVAARASEVLRAPIASVYFRPRDWRPPQDVYDRLRRDRPGFATLPASTQRAAAAGAYFGTLIRRGVRTLHVLRDGVPQVIEVEIGKQDQEFVEIRSDRLKPGDRVVVGERDEIEAAVRG